MLTERRSSLVTIALMRWYQRASNDLKTGRSIQTLWSIPILKRLL